MSCFSASRILTLVLTLAVLLAATSAAAQSSTEGAIGGVVVDPLGAVIVNATITVSNTGTGEQHAAATDATGHFRVIHLQPSIYAVSVRASGFAAFTQTNVVVEVGRITEVEARVAIAGQTEVIDVEAQASIIQTEQHDFNSNLNQTAINELPINGRRWSTFALLTPGATPDGDFGLISFRGISGLLNNNTVDGADNNQAFYAEERGRTRISFVVSSAAIREFQVNTSNFSAEYGRAAGGVINAVTKSGTNDLHGTIFYYNRNNDLGATNPFTTTSTLVNGQLVTTTIKPENVRHQFGAAFGGPLIKDKLFFFFTYDQQRNPNPGVAKTESASFLTPITVDPNLPAGATCNTSGLKPGQRLAACGITQSQADATVQYLVNLTGTTPRHFDEYTALPKFDWQVNSNHRLSVSYNRMRWFAPAGVQTQATVNRARDGFGDDYSHTDMAIARLTSVFGTHVSNELRYQWARDLEFQRPQTPLPGQPTSVQGLYPPEVCIGCTSSGSVQSGFLIGRSHSVMRIQPDEKRNQIADTISWTAGRHLLKFGVDYNHVWEMQDQLFYDSPEFSYNYLEDFIVDFNQPSRKRYQSFQQGFGPSRFHFTTSDYNLFLQDDWRVNSRLTLNLGMRWEYEQLPKPILPNPAVPQTAKFPSDKNNLGPRVGFALDLQGNGKTALRGGYGLFYGRAIGSTILNAMINTAMPGGQNTYYLTYRDAVAPQYPNLLAGAPSATTSAPSVVFFQKNFQLPLIHESDLVLEREIARNTVLSASWLFSKGTSLPIFVDQNLNPPTGSVPITYAGGPLDGKTIPMRVYFGYRPISEFYQMTEISSLVTSNYNAAVVQLHRRMTSGLQFNLNYTWSHAIDTQQSSTTFSTGNNIFDPYDLSLDKGNSAFNVPQRFVANVVWVPRVDVANRPARALFDGWSISPILTAQTGRQRDTNIAGTAPFSGQTQAGGVNGANGWNRVPALPRNYLRLPSPWVVDMRVARRFRFNERWNVEVLAEAFNVFNHVNPTSMLTTMYRWGCGASAPAGCTSTAAAPVLSYDPTVGTITGASSYLFRERQVQFAARLHF